MDNNLENVNIGVNFSQVHTHWLFGSDRTAKSALEKIVYDLGIKNYRLEAYWNLIQKNNFSELNTASVDWQLDIMGKSSAKNVILCLGRKVPHWPEYHIPEWTKKLSEDELKEKLLDYIARLIEYYARDERINTWQIENEVFFRFGLGRAFLDQEVFLKKEIETVRQYDKLNRPIIITHPGDKTDYAKAAAKADILGLSYYAFSKWWKVNLNLYYPRLLKSIETPQKWRSKIRDIVADKPVYLTEMQAEPWTSKQNQISAISEFKKSMSAERLMSNINFVLEAGFKDIYFWGAEWWLWMADNGHPEMWQTVKKLIKKYEYK